MSKATQISRHGGPEVLEMVDYTPGLPGPGEVLLRQYAAGLNMIDCYHRRGGSPQYALTLPAILGVEGAGVIEAVGPDVTQFKVGQRVAYLMALGGYAEMRRVPVSRLVALPDALSYELAASIMVKGCTTQYLLHQLRAVSAGDRVLVHAAAGGVGSLLCQWASSLGAEVIATVGQPEKVAHAKANGAAFVLNYKNAEWAQEIRDYLGGDGVDVVYDSIGAATFGQSLKALRPLGMMVSYGQASGPVAPVDPALLAEHGSVFLAKPTLATFVADPNRLAQMASSLINAITDQHIRPTVSRCFAQEELPQAHRLLENGETTGASVIRFEGLGFGPDV